MKYYGYYRVSTGTQVEKGQGLDTQHDGIDEWANKNNVSIASYFHDDGVSGTILDRDGLTDLLSVLSKDDRIVVLNTSRLWRDDFVKAMVQHTLKKIGADIISIEQPTYSIYTKDPAEFLTNGILELLDQYTRLEVNMKLAKGRRTKALHGTKACGSAPIGYKWSDREIEVDVANSEIVIDIFVSFVRLRSLTRLAEYCKEKGYKTLQGNNFSKQALRHILTNDFYVGVSTFGGVKSEGTQSVFITIEVFNEVQAIMGRPAIEK